MVKFLFFDSWTLEYVRGFDRVMCRPVKYGNNPIFGPQRPHEWKRTHLYGTVLFDRKDGFFKMWYSSHNNPQGTSHLSYAVSDDGYSWNRPDLDVVPGTNIVFPQEEKNHGPSILLDYDEPDPGRRYKLIMRPLKMPYIVGYVSPDGIHWKKIRRDPVIPLNSDSHIGLYRDSKTGLYQISLRADCPDRRVWRTESPDFITWRNPVLALEPDADDPPQTQIYGMQMTPYGSFVMGWISMFNTWEDDMGWTKMNGTMDVQLAYSRGGYCWHRVETGNRFIPLGGKDEWDSQLVIPSTSSLFLDDEIRFYYSGTRDHHGVPDKSNECIGTASLRPDGFVALETGEQPGELLTRSFTLRAAGNAEKTGSTEKYSGAGSPKETGFYVNADASRGWLKVELCDIAGKPLDGFSLTDCAPISGNGTDLAVRWNAGGDLIQAAGKPIRLRVRAERTSLYSLWMPNGDEDPKYWDFNEITCLDSERDRERL